MNSETSRFLQCFSVQYFKVSGPVLRLQAGWGEILTFVLSNTPASLRNRIRKYPSIALSFVQINCHARSHGIGFKLDPLVPHLGPSSSNYHPRLLTWAKLAILVISSIFQR